MSKSIVKAACGLLILSVVIVGLVGCKAMEEPEYADEMTESALVSMSNCDYAAHMEQFTPDAQAAINEADFNTSCQAIKAVIGDYIDKEFSKAETQNSYVVVYYTARYSEEPDDVEITVYFKEIDGEMYIAGFWLSSPKLIEAAEAATGE